MKKLILLLCSVVIAVNAMAQNFGPQKGMENSGPQNIATTDIEYWIGTGSNEAILSINFYDENESDGFVALAWGYRWDGSETVQDMLANMEGVDSRLEIMGVAQNYVSFAYSDDTYTFEDDGFGWIYTVNGQGVGAVNGVNIADGDLIEFIDYTGIADGATYPVEPTPVTNPNGTPALDPFTFDSVVYWVGEGSKVALLQVVWDNNGNNTSLAWGYKWNGDKTIAQMLSDIDSADSRLAIEGLDANYITNFEYSDGVLTLNNGAMGLMYQVNGAFPGGVGNTNLVDSAWVEFCDFSAMVGGAFPDVRPTAVTVAPEPPFGASDILYWAGEGSNQAILQFVWVDDNGEKVSFAWGYKWNGTAVVADMLKDIDSLDSRVTLTTGYGGSYLEDFEYNDGVVDLMNSGMSWMYRVNGNGAQAISSQPIVNGDYVYFCDYSAVNNGGWDVRPTAVPEPPFGASDILYWAGEGSNQAILQFVWVDENDEKVSFAWGYKWDGTAVVADMLKDIDSLDSRVTLTTGYGGSYLEDFEYNDGVVDLMNSGMSWMYRVNGNGAQAISSQPIVNGDYVYFCDYSAVNNGGWDVRPTAVTVPPVPAPEDATIAASDIVYWIGEGAHKAILAVNWATPDSALAWGYKFSEDSVTVKAMMDSIAAKDGRFSYAGTSMLSDINFVADEQTTWGITDGEYWMYNVNGVQAGLMFNAQKIGDGDLVKWGDPAAASAVVTDSSEWDGVYYPDQIVWTKEIAPVSIYVAPEPPAPDFGFDDILFWVGTGSKQAMMTGSWIDDNGEITTLAWGYKWDGDAVAADMLNAVNAADGRLSLSISGGLFSGFTYVDENYNLVPTGSFWMYNLNGAMASYGVEQQPLYDGDVADFYDGDCMNEDWSVPAFNPIAVTVPSTTEPTAEDATIAASDIVYWIGEGTNEAILVVNWATPDSALAWGYRFSEDSVTVKAMMDSIVAKDGRLSYAGTSMLSDINFVADEQTTWGITEGQYWMYNVNGVQAGLMFDAQKIGNGDLVKWGDPAAASAVVTDSSEWGGVYYPDQIVWTKEITAVPAYVAPEPPTPTFGFDDILYWVGTGSNQAIFTVTWGTPADPTVLAWGYKWDGDKTIGEMMSAIDLADDRLAINGIDAGYVDEITYNDGVLDLSNSGSGFMYQVNDEYPGGISNTNLVDSAFVEFCDVSAMDNYQFPDVMPTPVTVPSTPEPTAEDAIIAATEIKYWVGEGENEVIFSVNWKDAVLAWGYKFNEDTVTLKQVMDDIDAADYRFAYTGTGMVDDILFYAANEDKDGYDTLKLNQEIADNYWWSNVNGKACQHMFSDEKLGNGDFVKWGDPTAAGAVVLASSEYAGVNYPSEIVWTHAVEAVSAIGPYTAGVGTDGCEAISCENSNIKGWAVTCELSRGPIHMGVDDTEASYHDASDALGAVEMGNNLDVVSLGDGGMATVTFENAIKNGEGVDFAIFENSFNDAFLELAFVEVSSDGENFVRFPAVSLTQTETQIKGSGEIDPTNIYNFAGKYRTGWGTGFDLEELRDSANIDIDHVTHVRIIDVVGSIEEGVGTKDALGNMINDPFPTPFASCGFDLDGVAAFYMAESEGIDDVVVEEMSVYPNPTSGRLVCKTNSEKSIEAVIYDMSGRIVKRATINGSAVMDLSHLANGVYMLRAGEQTSKIVVRK